MLTVAHLKAFYISPSPFSPLFWLNLLLLLDFLLIFICVSCSGLRLWFLSGESPNPVPHTEARCYQLVYCPWQGQSKNETWHFEWSSLSALPFISGKLYSFNYSQCILKRDGDVRLIILKKGQWGPPPNPSTLCMYIHICETPDCPAFKIYLSADSSQIYFSNFPMGVCTCLSGRLLSLD